MSFWRIGKEILKTIEGLVEQDDDKIEKGLIGTAIGVAGTISPIHGTSKVLDVMNGEQLKYNGVDILRAENDVRDLLDFDHDGDVDLDDFSEAASSFLENVSDFFADL